MKYWKRHAWCLWKLLTTLRWCGLLKNPLDANDPVNWEIGPNDYPGGNPSYRMPLHPKLCTEGWCIELTHPAQELHYVRMQTPPLEGKRALVLCVKVEGKLDACDVLDRIGTISLFMQRAGDRYTADYEAFRWWGGTMHLMPGTYMIAVPLERQHWRSTLGHGTEEDFAMALKETMHVGFTLGGGTGLGHGVYVPEGETAKLTVTHFGAE